MSNTTITALPLASGVDGAVDWIAIDRTGLGATQRINRQTLLGVTGQPMDISSSQNVTNKSLDNTNTVTLKDTLFTLQDDADTTKQAKFQLSGITTATTRTYTLPNASSTIADISTAQTFTNKTLTSPVITGGSITGTTITTDAIIGQSVSTNGTIYGMSISGGKVGTNGVVTASITNSAVDYTKVATGFCVQQVNVLSATFATGTTTIPLDNTIPQNTEGDQYMTLSITPKSTTNVLEIDCTLSVANSSAVHLIGALFQDSTVNALVAVNAFQGTAGGNVIVRLLCTITAGTTAPTTFKVRAGGSGAGTTTFNGAAGAQLFGTATKSSMVIREYKA